jgi:hypothetical protein
MANTLILASAILIAGFLAGGRYTATANQTGAFVVDRFTGSVAFCGALEPCRPL